MRVARLALNGITLSFCSIRHCRCEEEGERPVEVVEIGLVGMPEEHSLR